jgi:hypothetical protein
MKLSEHEAGLVLCRGERPNPPWSCVNKDMSPPRSFAPRFPFLSIPRTKMVCAIGPFGPVGGTLKPGTYPCSTTHSPPLPLYLTSINRFACPIAWPDQSSGPLSGGDRPRSRIEHAIAKHELNPEPRISKGHSSNGHKNHDNCWPSRQVSSRVGNTHARRWTPSQYRSRLR